jgi:hypothetical protein
MSDYELSDRLSRFEYAINDNALQRFSPVAVDARVPPVSNL